jgi:uncharacterized protein
MLRSVSIFAVLFWTLAAAFGARAQPSLDLLRAAERGDITAARNALARGGELEGRDAAGRTALLIAAYQGHAETVALLLEAGADPRSQDAQKNDIIGIVAVTGRLDILLLSLARGAALTARNRYGGIPIIPASHYGHVEIVRALIGAGSPLDHVNDLGWTALLEAIILGDGGARHTEIVRLLVRAGARTDLADRSEVTPLAQARRRGYGEIVRILEAAGARE